MGPCRPWCWWCRNGIPSRLLISSGRLSLSGGGGGGGLMSLGGLVGKLECAEVEGYLKAKKLTLNHNSF